MKHIAFCVEQAYGHIMPTLGMAIELMRRGHHVTYAVTEALAPLVRSIGAAAVILNVTENRDTVIRELMKENDHRDYRVNEEDFRARWRQLSAERTEQSRIQLEMLYQRN